MWVLDAEYSLAWVYGNSKSLPVCVALWDVQDEEEEDEDYYDESTDEDDFEEDEEETEESTEEETSSEEEAEVKQGRMRKSVKYSWVNVWHKKVVVMGCSRWDKSCAVYF